MRHWLLYGLLLSTTVAYADMKANVDYQYYVAQADDDSTVLQLLNRYSPIVEDNQHYHGNTKWYVNWNFYWFERPNGRCKITQVKTTVTANIVLPQLINANAEQMAIFTPYLSALREHELGHYAISKEAGSTIDHYISTLPEMPNCQILEKTANEFGQKTLEINRAKEKQYDIETQHGKTQGAWLER